MSKTERNDSIAYIMDTLYGDVELDAIQYNELYAAVAELVDRYSNI